MFNLDTDSATQNQDDWTATCVCSFLCDKKFSKQCFHPHLKSNYLLFCMHIHSIKKRFEKTSLLCYSIVQKNQQHEYDANNFIIYKIKTVFNDTHNRFIGSNAYEI